MCCIWLAAQLHGGPMAVENVEKGTSLHYYCHYFKSLFIKSRALNVQWHRIYYKNAGLSGDMISVEFSPSNGRHQQRTMAFKLITVLCATLAFAHAGLLAPAAYSSAPAISHVYSSIGHQPTVIAHQPVIAHGKIGRENHKRNLAFRGINAL